jgi:hypothetical protein
VVHALTPASHPHLWRAAAVSVGRLGVIVDITLRIVRNEAVRRSRSELSVSDWVEAMGVLAANYSAVRSAGHADGSAAAWAGMQPWDRVQVFWFVPSRLLWKVSFSLNPADTFTVTASDGAAEVGCAIFNMLCSKQGLDCDGSLCERVRAAWVAAVPVM